MLTSNPPYPFWSAWIYLSTSERLFLVLLGGMSIYVVCSAAMTMSRTRKVAASLGGGHCGDAGSILAALRQQSAKVNKLIGTAFFLFGVVLFENMQWAYMTIDNSKTPVGWLILENFLPHFAFAFNVFFIFLILHVAGWFVSALINRFAVRLNPQQVA